MILTNINSSIVMKSTRIFTTKLIKTFSSNHQTTNKTIRVKITQPLIKRFSQISGDTNPLHIDKQYAQRSIFKQRIAHGMLPMGFVQQYFSSLNMRIKSMQIKFMKPIYLGEEIVIHIKLTDGLKNSNNVDDEIVNNFQAQIRKKAARIQQKQNKKNNNNLQKENIISKDQSQLQFSSLVTMISGQVVEKDTL